MKMENKVANVDIIYPSSMGDADPQALILCEGFITVLFRSNTELLKIAINNKLKLVECNDKDVKRFLDLIMKTKKFYTFYQQFFCLLHGGKLGFKNQNKLICYYEGKKVSFEVDEVKSLPDASLEVRKLKS